MYTYTERTMDEVILSTGENLMELSKDHAVLLVFLRHFGCTFCREALYDISKQRESIEGKGVKIVFVHMSDGETAERYFKRFDLAGIRYISDPECDLYLQFGLVKGNFKTRFGLNTFIRGFEAGVMKGLGVSKMIGDNFQMPGVFVIKNGEIRERFIHQKVSDQPDYEAMAQCCVV